MKISCASPTTLDSPEHVALAEDLGYDRAWLYDTPQQSPDVWMMLALAAQRTERIGSGPGVLVPSLRSPMVSAAATAALVAMAPDRTADQVAARLSELADGGVTELVYQPCGPDIRRELETFMAAARTAVPPEARA
jgi:hypothetical protein